ncbi:hypothetical protein PR048_013469 [Dryococelus australis]|uniref:Uncharacterized protein n=1 Tax=Dryococelus australis TaxID=614101 RepID=A0ABQ9HS92_9NEOP|nr:hypothetical protein PR048_013469 [Dryococelus australis]
MRPAIIGKRLECRATPGYQPVQRVFNESRAYQKATILISWCCAEAQCALCWLACRMHRVNKMAVRCSEARSSYECGPPSSTEHMQEFPGMSVTLICGMLLGTPLDVVRNHPQDALGIYLECLYPSSAGCPYELLFKWTNVIHRISSGIPYDV